MSPELSGVLVALITPFTDDGKSIDEQRLKSHIDHCFDAGCHGLVPGGSTGEFPSLTVPERKQLAELCVKYTNGRGPVVMGTASTSVAEVLELSVHAAKVGVSALMIVPPYYDAPNYEQLREFFAEVYEAAKIPLLYYHIPAASGTNLSAAEIAGLSDVGVKYMKDTSGNAPQYTELLQVYSDKVTAFNGWDTLTFYGLAAGAKGCVWGASNVIPELSAQLWEAVAVKKDLDAGRAIWAKIWPICKFLESHNYSSAVKTGMELQGFKTGGLRKPFGLLKAEHRAEFAKLLTAAGVKVVSEPNGTKA